MSLFQANDINAGVEEYQKTPRAKLIDVREEDEYAAGHIPASINIPLSKIESAQGEITDLDTPLFVYCRSGNRSGQAVAWLKQAGYSKVQNIGGIANYSGKTE
ncbi:rhodanese-like domain-containing protein [Lactobacillus delbrueckii]|jgi:rhodanese-related sulfurtransferase|uniref:Rhodanese domain-containing protein n=1 Tax=Lactobacillus delbrueckii subsp. delbrueckii TaxID=83684 RepID=A0AAU9R100_9LACO|nr:rhodanese-like domain-containing protein [Lactobacillus delbrueckii]CAH1706181.1 Rhodanese domain-containing protein [Lactobacillus delbrueckii subsp. delbrueckii]APG73316.1 sulfurtransferase [Lactobacillus delbrueckii subsp. jakobsenii ZN7a-9 = DSM 26046]APG74723.1 sulfurtransferase [Lactobacillus delbrueckii subsp. sunkii]EOD02926.1 rhodanese-related sulfurtransferase [Lactobacillus delbrueckii subsp. jakobsenii ZN7a-9 = DSM 26046]KNE74167.1 sulfurtransferase [Lactobacillus delbrueckii su